MGISEVLLANVWPATIIFVLAIAGMLSSNIAFYNGIPFYISRKVAHFGAVVPILLMPVFFEEWFFPVGLSASLALVVFIGNRMRLTEGFAKEGRLSDILFPVAVAITIGLLWHKGPWIAVVPAVWLSLGDGITGLVRMKVYGREVKGNWGSVACLLVCVGSGLALGVPALAAMVGSALATLAERVSGDSEGAILRIDDNLSMPLIGAAALFLLV